MHILLKMKLIDINFKNKHELWDWVKNGMEDE